MTNLSFEQQAISSQVAKPFVVKIQQHQKLQTSAHIRNCINQVGETN